MKLDGFPLFAAATAAILDEMTRCERTSFTWEEKKIVDIHDHYVMYGVAPVWVKGWARVARYIMGQSGFPFRKNNWRIRKDADNRTRREAKYGPRKRVYEMVGGWSFEFDD